MFNMIEQIVAAQPDLVIAARVPATAAISRIRKLRNVDVVISGAATGALGPALPRDGLGRLFEHHPRKLLTIGEDGRRGTLWVLRPHRAMIDELSAETLLAAIREEA